MSIVHQTDKRSGITYAYESTSYWDKEKKQGRCKRKLLGRVDPETGEIVPTDGRCLHRSPTAKTEDIVRVKRGRPSSSSEASRKFFGDTYLLDKLGEGIGLTEDLRKCFPDDYKKMLSIAYYMITESDSPLSRFAHWDALHSHPYGKDIPSQRSSELFASVREEQKVKFFGLQGKRRDNDESWAFDSTSISSYSECLKQARYGHNKEDDRLPQINLLLLFGQKSHLPFYFRKLSGNDPDVKTILPLLCELRQLTGTKVKLLTDRGFYSKSNIDALYAGHYKFLMGLSTSLKMVSDVIDKARGAIVNFANYDERHEVYVHSESVKWGVTGEEGRLAYLHVYYNAEKAADDAKSFSKRLIGLRNDILSKTTDPAKAKQYERYFEVSETPKRGVKVIPKQDEIDAAQSRFGFFALLTNDVKEPVEALDIYRQRDCVEKAFGNIKDRLNCRRMLVSSESGYDGKLFVAFIALILLSCIQKRMGESGLDKLYTMQEMLDELDVVECFSQPGKTPYIGELLGKQADIYAKMGVPLPGSRLP